MATVRGPQESAAAPGGVGMTAVDLLGGLWDRVHDRYAVLGVLGTNAGGEHAYLGRDLHSKELVALKLTPAMAPSAAGSGSAFALATQRVLDDTIPALQGNCQSCNAPLVGWQRYCIACGTDVTGIAPGDHPDTSRAALLATVKAAARDFEVLGAIDRELGGGPVYFARSLTSGQLVALRLHATADPQPGRPRFELAATHIMARQAVPAASAPPAPPITPWPAVVAASAAPATAVNDIFISYSHADKSAADAVCAGLEGAGLRCWMAPRDILPGRSWAASIVEAITQSRILVLVFSSHTNASQQVLREVERAVHHDLPVVPFRIEEVLFSRDLEYYFSAVHWLDAFPPPLEPHLRELTRVARALLGSQPPRGPSPNSLEQPAPRAEDAPRADRPVTPPPFIFISKPAAPEPAASEVRQVLEPERTPAPRPAAEPTPAPAQAPTMKYCPICGSEYAPDLTFCPKDAATLRSGATGGDLIGQVVGNRYRVLRKLGEGGMGTVYLAEHVQIGRLCALKVVKSQLASDRDAMKRFANEAKLASKVNHPNVAIIYDYGEDTNGIVYLSMEYIDGKPLSDLLHPEGGTVVRLPTTRAISIAEQVADALAAAHKLGVIHRDLKPDNILVSGDPDIVKVVDFGIAKAAQDSTHTLTHMGFVVGTPRYMSPEQMTGDPVDGRTDVFSLGCVLYEMLTGEYSVDAPSIQAVLTTRLTTPPPSPRERNPSLTRELDDVVLKALAIEPSERFATIADFRDALRAALAHEEGAPPEVWSAERPRAEPVAADSLGAVAAAPVTSTGTVPSSPVPEGPVPRTVTTPERAGLLHRVPRKPAAAALGVAVIAAIGLAVPWHRLLVRQQGSPVPETRIQDSARGAVARDSVPASDATAPARSHEPSRAVPVAKAAGAATITGTDSTRHATSTRIADSAKASSRAANEKAPSGAVTTSRITAQPPRRVVDHLVVIAPAAPLSLGESKPLVATATDTKGDSVIDCTTSWSSDDPTIASVNASTGVVRGSAAGSTRITASCEGKSASTKVTVRAAEPPPQPPPLDPAVVAEQEIGGEVQTYVAWLRAHDVAHVSALNRGAAGTGEAQNADRLVDLLRRSGANLSVSGLTIDPPQVQGDHAVSTFAAQLSWRSAFGAGRGEHVFFRGEFERLPTGWHMVACRPTGNPGLR